jgi:CRISPR-associated protein Cmr4
MANTTIYWLHTLSPTHVGTGRGVGYIDLPIHRDKVTNWPLIPGSAFKGVWADYCDASEKKRQTDEQRRLAFGLASDSDNRSNAGALVPTDARLVCLPVRSFQGTFAWCTSPMALRMLRRDLVLAGIKDLPDAPVVLPDEVIHYPNKAGTVLKEGERIYLEDLDFQAKPCGTAEEWAQVIANGAFADEEDDAWRAEFVKRFAVLPDAVFDFLTETATEVIARVKIDDDTKTVASRMLWNEEALPAETILCGLIFCDRLYAEDNRGVTPESLLQEYATKTLSLQIGGKATVGRGRVRCVFNRANGGRSASPNK